MCSISGSHPVSAAHRLHEVLDDVLDADLSGLGSQERARLVALLVRAQHRVQASVLDAVAAFDSANAAAGSPHRTTRQWLQHQTRLSPAAEAQLTRTARALRDHLADTRTTLAAGSISGDHVAAIADVVSTVGAENAAKAEPVLLDLARRYEPSVVRRATSELFALLDPEGAERALKNAYEKRGLKLSVVGHHGYLNGVFDVESTELLRAALQPLMRPSGAGDRRGITQLRADALLDLAQHSLDTAVQPELGNQRPQLSVVVDAERLKSGRGGVGLPWTGAVVPVAVARRWACDAEVSGVVASVLPPPRAIPLMLGSSPDLPQITGGWLPLDVGRASRLATTGQVKALRVRDGGCVHPGCPRTAAYCHAHHVTHWADGGGTDLSNLVLLCRHHHRSLHDGVWRLRADPDRPGRFMASTPAGWTAAQTAADRSPPMRQRPPTLATVSRE